MSHVMPGFSTAISLLISATVAVNQLAGGQPAGVRQDDPAPGQSSPGVDRFYDPLPRGALERLGTLRLRHSGRITSLIFSADDKIVVSSGSDNGFHSWEVATGRKVHEWQPNPKGMEGVAYATDRRAVASCGIGRVHLCDLRTGREIRQFGPETGEFWAVGLSGGVLSALINPRPF